MISSEVLKEFGLFNGLNDGELAKIAEFCHERKWPAGTICYVQDRNATDVNLCRRGEVDIIIQLYEPSAMEVKVHTVRAGEVFGWSSLMEPHTYSSSARCAGRVDEVYFKGAALLALFERDHRIGYVVMRNLSATINSRLTQDRQRLARELKPDFKL